VIQTAVDPLRQPCADCVLDGEVGTGCPLLAVCSTVLLTRCDRQYRSNARAFPTVHRGTHRSAPYIEVLDLGSPFNTIAMSCEKVAIFPALRAMEVSWETTARQYASLSASTISA